MEKEIWHIKILVERHLYGPDEFYMIGNFNSRKEAINYLANLEKENPNLICNGLRCDSEEI